MDNLRPAGKFTFFRKSLDVALRACYCSRVKAKLLARGNGTEFWQIGSEVYRTPAGDKPDVYGLPMARRWECSASHWLKFRKVYDWAQDAAQ